MGYVLKAVLSSAQHPEYGQITVPFPIPDEKYDRMIELLEPLEIGDALRQDCRVDELDSFYTVLNRLVGSLVNFDELDYLAKRLDSFDDGEAAQFQGMACKLGVSNIKDFINLTFCCQQATVITDFSDLDAIGRQHYMTMQGGGCRIEELERLDGRKFALDLILNHLEGRITPYGVVYDNGMKLEQLYDGRHFPCYHYQPNLLAVGLSSRQEPENTDQITWLLLPCSEQQLQRGIARSGVNIHDARIWYEDSLLPSEVEEVLEGQREDLFALNDMATAIAALSDLEQKKLTAVMEMAKPECAGEIRELAKNLELFEFAPKVRTPAEYGRYMIQDSGHYEYDPNLEEFYDYERYGKLRMEKETGAFTEKGYVAYSQIASLQSEHKDWDEDLKAWNGLEAQPAEEHPQFAVAGLVCRRIGARCKEVQPDRAVYQFPGLLLRYRNDLHWGRFDQAMERMETMAALALSVVLRECKQMGTALTTEQGVRFLESHILPHQNRGILKNRADEIAMQFQSVLAKNNCQGIRTQAEKKEVASAWLELAISCAKVPVKYEADEIKRRQKEEKTQREAEPVMA